MGQSQDRLDLHRKTDTSFTRAGQMYSATGQSVDRHSRKHLLMSQQTTTRFCLLHAPEVAV